MKLTVVHSIARNEIFLCLTYPFKAFCHVSCDYFYSDFLKPTVARYAANLTCIKGWSGEEEKEMESSVMLHKSGL